MGGLFRQFKKDQEGHYSFSGSGIRRMAAVALAINKVNNKSDKIFDKLLKNTQVY